MWCRCRELYWRRQDCSERLGIVIAQDDATSMRFLDIITTALNEIRANKLRSFFTLLGIIVSVAFLVAVVAVIQ